MKKILFGFLLMAFTFNAKAQSTVSDTKAIQMLRTFYTSYMTAIASSDPNTFKQDMKKNELLKKEYCTKKMLIDILRLGEETDSDPIIKAQDSRMDCVKNLTFSRNNKKPNAYTVNYFYIDEFTKRKNSTTINLTVVNEHGKYKINTFW